jgi:GNAT superfamily N-acetyltransferase
MKVSVRQATEADVETVSGILQEAASWLERRGIPLWRADELAASRIVQEVSAGLFQIAESDGQPAGTMKFQLEDPLFWSDVQRGESAFVHRLAVRRCFAGGAVSNALLQWAVQRTHSLGRKFLRLDCDAARPKLRAIYERFGFRYRSDRQVGPYLVARYEYDVSIAARE